MYKINYESIVQIFRVTLQNKMNCSVETVILFLPLQAEEIFTKFNLKVGPQTTRYSEWD